MTQTKEWYLEHFQDLYMRGLPAEEYETVIVIRRTEKNAAVSTTDPTMLTKIKRCMKTDGNKWELVSVTHPGDDQDPLHIVELVMSAPKKLIALRSGKPRAVKGSEEDDFESASPELDYKQSGKEVTPDPTWI